MRRFIYAVFLTSISLCTSASAKDGIQTNWPVAVQEFRETGYNFSSATDMNTGTSIEWVFVQVEVPKGKRLSTPDDVSKIMKKEFRSGEFLGKSDVVGPPLIGEWAMFDGQGESMCLFTMYMGDIFCVSGLKSIDPGLIYQCCSNEYWRGSFVSEELRKKLLGDPKLFIDQNKTNNAHWRSMILPLLPKSAGSNTPSNLAPQPPPEK